MDEGKSPKFQKRRRSLCCSCFGLQRQDSLLSIYSDKNEPYEYVVEKLVIKRIPVKKVSENESLKLSLENSGKVNGNSIITFSSYCQVPPRVEENVQEKKNEEKLQGGLRPESPKEEMTSGRRQQLQNCNYKKMTMAQIHKSPPGVKRRPRAGSPAETNDVLFVKSPRAVSPVTKSVDPAVKETLDLLATKKMHTNPNRRLIQRDPETGQIKEIFQNIKIDEPYKLEKLFKKDKNIEGDPSSGDNRSSTQTGLKWKIIIKHKESQSRSAPCSSNSFIDSEF